MDVIEKKNSLTDLMDFFSTDERPVKPAEFKLFWNSISDEEKAYYKNAELG